VKQAKTDSPLLRGRVFESRIWITKQKGSAAVVTIAEPFYLIGQGRFGCPVINELRILGI
jgi:hypothetical protein